MQLVPDLVPHHPRDADPTRFGQRLEPGRHIHPVAEDIVALDNDVAEVDADTKPDAPVLGQLGAAVHHPPLNLGGAADRINNARKFHQHAITGSLYDTTVVLLDLRIDELASM